MNLEQYTLLSLYIRYYRISADYVPQLFATYLPTCMAVPYSDMQEYEIGTVGDISMNGLPVRNMSDFCSSQLKTFLSFRQPGLAYSAF